MASRRYLFRVYCLTQQIYTTVFSNTAPTTCPIDNQPIDTSLTTIMDSSFTDIYNLGYVNIQSALADSEALKILASDTNGGILIEAGMGGIMTNTTNTISLNAAAASNFTTSNGNLTLKATAGLVNIDGGSGLNIGNLSGSTPINIGTSSFSKAINIGNLTSTSILNLLSGTGGVNIDTASGGQISLDATGASSNFTLTATANSQDLTFALLGSYASRLYLLSQGTGNDSIFLNSAGGITSTAGSNGIFLNSYGGNINIANSAGADINIGSSFISRNINIGTSQGATTINLYSGTGGIQTSTSGTINLASSNASGSAITLDASSAGGLTISGGIYGIGINATGAIGIGHWYSPGSMYLGTGGQCAITLGNTTGTTSVTINTGTGGISLGNNSNSSNTIIRNGTGGLIKTQLTPAALSDSNQTLTISDLLTGILSGNPTANRNLTLPTAANIVAGITNCQVNDAFDFTIINNSSAVLFSTLTLVTNTGGSSDGNLVIYARSNALATIITSGSGLFRLRITNISSGTEAYTVYRLS